MKWLLSPIQSVIDKFKSLMDWVGNNVGGFLNKINPFTRSITIDAEVGEVREMDSLSRVALSGSYYTSDIMRAREVNKILQVVNGLGQ